MGSPTGKNKGWGKRYAWDFWPSLSFRLADKPGVVASRLGLKVTKCRGFPPEVPYLPKDENCDSRERSSR